MIADWETDTVYLADHLRHDHFNTIAEIDAALSLLKISLKLLPGCKDIWARDFMPIQVNEHKFVEYQYDPDYLKKMGRRGELIKTDPDKVCNAIGLKTVKTNIILDGGNLVKSSNAIILTDKVVWENRKRYTKVQLLNELHVLFEVDKVVLIPWDDACEYGHADGMLRFIDDDTVLISGFYETADDSLREGILKSLRQNNLSYEWLRCSDKKEEEKNIAYINFLQTKDVILLPKLYRDEDDKAFEQICCYYPEYAEQKRIVQMDVRKVFKKDGALNCISWTIKKSGNNDAV